MGSVHLSVGNPVEHPRTYHILSVTTGSLQKELVCLINVIFYNTCINIILTLFSGIEVLDAGDIIFPSHAIYQDYP